MLICFSCYIYRSRSVFLVAVTFLSVEYSRAQCQQYERRLTVNLVAQIVSFKSQSLLLCVQFALFSVTMGELKSSERPGALIHRWRNAKCKPKPAASQSRRRRRFCPFNTLQSRNREVQRRRKITLYRVNMATYQPHTGAIVGQQCRSNSGRTIFRNRRNQFGNESSIMNKDMFYMVLNTSVYDFCVSTFLLVFTMSAMFSVINSHTRQIVSLFVYVLHQVVVFHKCLNKHTYIV